MCRLASPFRSLEEAWLSRLVNQSRALSGEQPDLAVLGARVSAARAATEARGGDVLSGGESRAPGRVPAQGTLGRLGRAVLARLACP